jgi:hypothetical protein
MHINTMAGILQAIGAELHALAVKRGSASSTEGQHVAEETAGTAAWCDGGLQ